MSELVIGVIGIGFLLFLMLFGMPIGFVMAFIGFLGLGYLNSFQVALYVMGTEPFGTLSSYTLSVLPLFLLMGQFAFASGTSERLFSTANKWLGHYPGGLAMATIGGCAGFAAICGSSLATSATAGSVTLSEMRKYHYDLGFATGCIAAGGTLGILIPPSGILIIYGILTEQSIAKLFIAGMLPGLMLTSLFMLTIYILVKRNPNLGVSTPKVSFSLKMKSLLNSIEMLVLFVIVIGGLYGGLFTANEAAGIGAGGALLIGLIRRKLDREKIIEALVRSVTTSSMIFTIIIGAMIFNRFLAITGIPVALADFVCSLQVPPFITIFFIFFIYMILGCFFDSLAITMLTVPIFYDVILMLKMDPIWFGVLFVVMIEMASITPPVGMNVYVISAVAQDVPIAKIFRGIFPFLIPLAVMVVLLIFFPQLALILPKYMG